MTKGGIKMKALKFISKLLITFSVVAFLVMPAVAFGVTGSLVTYQVNGQSY
jgi:hypothetical protein